MYEYIKGTLASLSHTTAVIEAGGVGYSIGISLTTHAAIDGRGEAMLYTHLYTVADQSPLLYGFATLAERTLFRMLISVSGIGAGTARIMLSSHSPSELASMIATGNSAMLTKVKGIGAKTAEVVIIKLRDKVTHIGLEQMPQNEAGIEQQHKWQEAIEALQVLGFSKVATEKTVRKLVNDNPAMATEDIIRNALSMM